MQREPLAEIQPSTPVFAFGDSGQPHLAYDTQNSGTIRIMWFSLDSVIGDVLWSVSWRVFMDDDILSHRLIIAPVNSTPAKIVVTEIEVPVTLDIVTLARDTWEPRDTMVGNAFVLFDERFLQ